MDPKWKKLSRSLYSAGETLAVDIARPYIQTVTGINNVMFTCTTYTYHDIHVPAVKTHIMYCICTLLFVG